MARNVKTERERTATATAEFADGDNLLITYRLGLITPEFWPSMFNRPARQVLADLLVSWDLEDDDHQPMQPAPLTDVEHWNEAARQARVDQAITQRIEEASKAQTPVALPTDKEAEALRAEPPTAVERRAAYTAAWCAILATVPQFVLLTVHDTIIKDVRPGK
ncbi:MAG TPA: hypothetical protein VFS21_30225 [Roseiflexaceae bacterium]|nr:hypothetical protein [Roseiflexaceae bacterium]